MIVQKLRLQRGWSQQQLAEFSGLSTRTIQRLENGHSASVESLKALAAVFEVDFHSLQGESAMSISSLPSSEHSSSAQQIALEREEAEALRYVRELKRFYHGLAIYLLVITLLAVINWWTNPDYWWFLWVALGWGAGLLLRAARVFDLWSFLGPAWEKRQVEKRLGRKL